MSAKQDRQGVRKASDIERKYNLDRDYTEIINVANNAQRVATTAAARATSAQNTANEVAADFSAILERVLALESAVIVSVIVTDDQNSFATSGTLTVANHVIEQSGVSVIVPGGNAVISYTLKTDVSRSVTVNGTVLGTVAATGDAVSGTIPVTSGSEITIEFT